MLQLLILFLVMLVDVITLLDSDIVVKNVIIFKCVKNAFGEDELHLVIQLNTMLKSILVMYVYYFIYILYSK